MHSLLADPRMFWNLFIIKYAEWRLQHVLLLIILVFYSLFGAVSFVAFEQSNELANRAKDELNKLRRSEMAKSKLFKDLHRYQRLYYGPSSSMTFKSLYSIIENYDQEMQFNDGRDRPIRWTLWGGLYYAGTIYTTIGYGDMATETTGGRIFTMFYAAAGIPLVITILNDWGSLLFHAMQTLWKTQLHRAITKTVYLFNLWKQKMGLEKQHPKRSISRQKLIDSSEIDLTEDSIPITAAVVLLLFWVIICAFIFRFFEHWSLFESIYFFFVSLTTIGFGDLTPNHQVAVANFLLILMGLSVVSMSINVIQLQLQSMFSKIMRSIERDFKNHIMDENAENETRDTIVDGKLKTDEGIEKGVQVKVEEVDFVREYEQKNIHGTDRLLMMFMSKHQKKLLNDRYEARAKMRNGDCQTRWDRETKQVQTDDIKRLDELERLKPLHQEDRRCSLGKFYIYNTGE